MRADPNNNDGLQYTHFGQSVCKVKVEERGATIGIQSSIASLASAVGGYLGGQFMYLHDFQTPLLMMAGLYFLSNVLLWTYFHNAERPAPQFSPAAAASAGR